MVCFKRGNTYRGTIALPVSGTSSSPIRFNAYGSGSAPIVSGFDAVTSPWSTYSGSGNIYKTTIATGLTPKQLQVSGSVQKLARHPNTGWLKTTNKTSTSTSGDWIGTQPAGSLVGANIVEMANPWAWFRDKVTAQSGSTVTFNTGAAIFIQEQAGWSYGFENKLSFLDSAGEWYYNDATGELYLWAPGNANPNSLLVEISSRNFGVTLTYQASDSDIQFKNLVFEGFSTAVSQDSKQKRMVYENLEMRKSGRALLMWTPSTAITDANTIRNNYIHDIQQDAVSLFEGNGHIFEGNVVKDVGVDPWLAANPSSWGMIGLNTGTSNQTIRRNKFENIGYTGIFVNGSGLVTENYLENMLVSTTDGAGIMWNVADGLTVKKNIVKNVHSNMSNLPLPYLTYPEAGIANAYYVGDNTVMNTTVEENVAIDIGNDAYVIDHGTEYINNRVINNIGFDFGRGGVFLTDASIYRDIPHWYTSWANGYAEEVFGVNYPTASMTLCEPYNNSACFRAQFNDVVTGNKLYSLVPDNASMDNTGKFGSRGIYMFYSYSNGTGAHVDYGTINNNYYYNRLSPERVTTRWPVIGPFTTTDYTLTEWQNFSGEDRSETPGDGLGSTDSSYPASSTRPEPEIFYNATKDIIQPYVNGCDSNGTPLTGNQEIEPFSALVVEYGNC